MKLTMLGTGNALVTECYNTCFVVQNGKQHLLVDGGGGNTLLAQLKHAGFNWMDMREIFVTHKHVDHLMGIVWMIRMICQYMRQGQYQGEAWIYGHDEVIAILKEMADRLLSGKETCFIGNRLHMEVVGDGEERTLIGKKVTFLILAPPKRSSTDSAWIWEMEKSLPAVGTSPTMSVKETMQKTANGSFMRLFVFMIRQRSFILMKSITPRRRMPVSWQKV